MPGPLAIPIIGAAAGIAGGAINAASTGNQNRASRDFSLNMYKIQKQDNLDFWNMQNSYNSPQAQMQRLQQAGLNPNLVYGGSGNSGSASPISTPDVKMPDFRAPQWGDAITRGASNGLDAYFDVQIKQATANNLEKQGNVLDQEAMLKAAQTDATKANTNRSIFDLDFENEFRGISGDARRFGLEKLKTDIDVTMNRDAREAALNSSSLREAAERMLSMQSQRGVNRVHIEEMRKRIDLMNKEGVLKDLDIALREKGISPSDPMWARIVGTILNNFSDGTNYMLNSFRSKASMPDSNSVRSFIFGSGFKAPLGNR